VQILKDKPNAIEDDIREGLDGNICCCTGYQNIVRAVQAAANGSAAPVSSPAVTA